MGQAEQDCQDRAAKIRQSKQDKKERTAGQNIQQGKQTRQTEQDCQLNTVWTVLLDQDIWSRTAGT
jgi:hypothetical protein